MKVCTFCLCLSVCHPNSSRNKPKWCQCTLYNTCMYTNSTLFIISSTNTKWFVGTRTWCKETAGLTGGERKRRAWRLNWETVLWAVFWWIGCNFQHQCMGLIKKNRTFLTLQPCFFYYILFDMIMFSVQSVKTWVLPSHPLPTLQKHSTMYS